MRMAPSKDDKRIMYNDDEVNRFFIYVTLKNMWKSYNSAANKFIWFEIREDDAHNLINSGINMICEGADMPSTPEAVKIFMDKKLLYAPGKAANAGGVAVSGLEMAQNRMLLNWSAEEVDQRLRAIMKNIHQTCLDVAAEYGEPGNYLVGANIAGFVRVVDAMLDQGVV